MSGEDGPVVESRSPRTDFFEVEWLPLFGVSRWLVGGWFRPRLVGESREAVERPLERLAPLNLASDSKRPAFLALSSEEKVVERWQVAG